MVREQFDYQAYMDAVVRCMVDELHFDARKVNQHLHKDEAYIRDLFAEDPEIIFHDDPMRLAVSLGVRWGLIQPPNWTIKRPR